MSPDFADELREGIQRAVLPHQELILHWMLYQGREFERRLRNLFTETGQHTHAAIFRGSGRIGTRLLALNIQTRLFAIAKKVRIVTHPVITELNSQVGEIIIVGIGDRVRQIHRVPAGQTDRAGAFDQTLFQCSQSHRNLYGGAGLESAAQRQTPYRTNAPFRRRLPSSCRPSR